MSEDVVARVASEVSVNVICESGVEWSEGRCHECGFGGSKYG